MIRPTSSALALALPLLLAPTGDGGDGGDGGDRHVARSKDARTIAALVERGSAVGISGSVLAAKDGAVLVAAGVGLADAEEGVPNTAETLHEIASASKPFTAAAVCRLVDQGKLAFDDSIAVHLPAVPDDCAAITVRHLLQHTSGIPGTNARGGGDDLRAVVPVFLDGGPQHGPGTHWEYWNQGYALVAGVIERASGRDFTAYCERELFRRAGLEATCFTGDPVPKGRVVAVGRSARGDRSALDHPYGSFGYQYRGMGGVVTTVRDLWRWDRALAGNALLEPRTKAALFEPGVGGYALGWHVDRTRGRLVQHHGGGVRGFVCQVRRFPEEDAALFVLCNDDAAPVHAFTDLLERALFGEEVVAPPYPLPAELQARAAGSYRSDRGALLIVTPRGAATKADVHWGGDRGPVSRLWLGVTEEAGDDLVLYEWQDAQGVHAEEEDGVVTALRYRGATYTRVEQE